MRHRVFGRKLNRDIKERKALFRSLINSFIIKGQIKTTYAKAKAVGSLIEKLVTKAKDGSRSSIGQISSVLNIDETVKKLVNDIAPRFKDKIGGFIRMIRLGRRQGDNAQVVRMEWTIKEEKKVAPKVTKTETKKETEVKTKKLVKQKKK